MPRRPRVIARSMSLAASCRVFGLALAPLLVSAAGVAQAGGLSLPEDGGPINGTAQAGSAAVARDAQTAWLNPAGMTRLDAPEFMLTFQPLLTNFEFNPAPATTTSGTNGGQQGGWLPSGAMFFAAPLADENVAFGLSLTSPAGTLLDPDDGWVGRYFMTSVSLAVINIEPSIGVRLGDHWSLGGGIDFQYARFQQELAVNRGPLPDSVVGIDGDSWAVGFSLSALWEPSEMTRLGLRYRSQVNHGLRGDLTAFTSAPVSTGLVIPQSLTLSGYHDFGDTVALVGDFGWQDWSAFDRTVISIDALGGVQAELPRNFRDTWTFSLGTHLHLLESWMFMAGAGYTSSAVSDGDRTPDLPTDEQVRASLGVEWDINDTWNVGANYTFIWLGNNNVDAQLNALTGRVVGDYDARLHVFGLYGSLAF